MVFSSVVTPSILRVALVAHVRSVLERHRKVFLAFAVHHAGTRRITNTARSVNVVAGYDVVK